MSYWSFHTAGEIVFGRGVIRRLGRQAAERGLRRLFIVTDRQLEAAGALERTTESLDAANIEWQAFTGGEAEPSIEAANDCRRLAASFSPDGVLGLGGGSNMDLAKIVSTLLAHGGDPPDYFGPNRVPGPVLPIICVPTTAGTGSEVSHSGVLTDCLNAVKVSTLSNYLRPALAIVDPELTLTCPRRVTAESGIDALVHAIEAYTNRGNAELDYSIDDPARPTYFGAQPLTDTLAEQAIRLIGRHLRIAVESPREYPAREGMALAATLAGMAFSNAGVALVHALEYPVGGATGCGHGAGNGLLLPHVMRFNLPNRLARFARIAKWLGVDTRRMTELQAAEAAVEAVESLNQQIGVPRQLRELGAEREQLPDFAAATFEIKRLLAINPREATEQDLLEILKAAF